MGTAKELISWSRELPLGSWSVVTSTIRPPERGRPEWARPAVRR
jgi:hypothetical protein